MEINKKNLDSFVTNVFELVEGLFPTEQANYEHATPKRITFKELPYYTRKWVEVNGILSKVYPPKDCNNTTYVCDECGCTVPKGLCVKKDNELHHYDICPNCSDLNTIRDKEYYYQVQYVIDYDDYSKCSIEGMAKFGTKYSIQLLEFTHPDSLRKIYVGYIFGVNGKEFANKDKGMEYTIIGRLNQAMNNYVIQSDTVEIVPITDDEVISIEDTRDIPGYDEWREHVLSRDKKCIVCGGDKQLHAHHIYGYKEYPNLRTDKNNGVAVCKFCHEKYHHYYGVKEITPIKFLQFMRRFLTK